MPNDFIETNKYAYKIISTVSDITIDFLNKINPDILEIFHIRMENESDSSLLLKMNKRAKINYQFLKDKIPMGYNIAYYQEENNTSVCIIFKNGYDYSELGYDEKYRLI